ncbi:MAG: hypothetical protein ACRDYV_03140 [Acidimicrobiia bacterium]
MIPVRWVRFLPPPLFPQPPRRQFVKKLLIMVVILALGALVAKKKLA